MDFLTNLDFWFTVLRATTPVLFATMAALIASRSGMLNLGLEGAMTIAALCGVLGSGFTGSLLVGAVCGLAAGIGFTMLLAYFVQHLKANQVISGVALNLAASGGSVFCSMQKAAAADGVTVWMQSGYRSVKYQTSLYERKTKYYLDKGYDNAAAKEKAAAVVNPPGYSEHNCGLAADLNSPEHTGLDRGS